MSCQQNVRAARRRQPPRLHNGHRPPLRTLQIERLESRVVLSGLPEVEVPILQPWAEPVPSVPAVVESVSAAGVISTDAAALVLAQGELDAAGTPAATGVAGPAADSTSSASILMPDVLTGPSTTPTAPAGGAGPPGGSGQPLMPPIITDFDAEAQGDWWRFTGTVLDDKDVTGLTVVFGGLLAGRTAQVDCYGMFEIVIRLGFHPVGTVSATTTDSDGLRSETVSIVLS